MWIYGNCPVPGMSIHTPAYRKTAQYRLGPLAQHLGVSVTQDFELGVFVNCSAKAWGMRHVQETWTNINARVWSYPRAWSTHVSEYTCTMSGRPVGSNWLRWLRCWQTLILLKRRSLLSSITSSTIFSGSRRSSSTCVSSSIVASLKCASWVRERPVSWFQLSLQAWSLNRVPGRDLSELWVIVTLAGLNCACV